MIHKNLLEVCTPKQWTTLSTKSFISDGKYPIYGANGIIGYYNDYNHINETVVIGCRGTCGAESVRIVPPYSYVNGNAMCFDNLVEEIDIKFFFYFLKSLDYTKIITGVAQPQITAKSLSTINVPLLPLSIQKNMVKELDAIQNQVSNNELLLQNCDDLIKSRFIEMFGSIEENNKFEIVNIEDVCLFVKDGTHQTPQYTEDSINGFKFLSSKDVMTQKIDWSNIKYIPAELHEKLYATIKPQKNDILMSKNGVNYGVAAVNDTDEIFDIYVSLAIMRPLDIIEPYFFRCVLNSEQTKKQFDSSIKGIGVPNLHLGEIKKTKIILPPMELQKEFVEFVKLIDKSKFSVQKEINLYQELLEKKMNEYFG